MTSLLPSRGRLPASLPMVALCLLGLVAATGSAMLAARAVSDATRDRLPGLRGEGEARAALRHQPLDTEALRDLALAEGGATGEGLALLRLADRVSRRDPATQLLLLEAGAQSGDIAATLRHYDALLATTPNSGKTLLGILEGAIADPAIRVKLTPYAGRPWFLSLVKSTASRPGSGMLALSLAREAGLLAHSEARDEIAPHLISSLLSDGRAGEAVALAEDLGVSDWHGMGFSRSTLDRRLGSLGWQLERTASILAEWRQPDALAISVEPGRLAAAARRVTVLAPGRYRLSFSLDTPAQPLARLEWRLSCRGGTGDVERVAVRPGDVLQAYRASLAIPADCPVQAWSLWVEGADAQVASQAELLGLRMERE